VPPTQKLPFSQTAFGYVVLGVFIAVVSGLVVKLINEPEQNAGARALRENADGAKANDSAVVRPAVQPSNAPVAAADTLRTTSGTDASAPIIPNSKPNMGAKFRDEPGGKGETHPREEASQNSTPTGAITTTQASPAASAPRERAEQSNVNSPAPAIGTMSSPGTSSSTALSNADSSRRPVETNNASSHEYRRPESCIAPMTPGEFRYATSSIRAKSFESTKSTVAKQIFNDRCMLSWQVKDIMLLFDFEATRLDFAKFAWLRTVDPQNYFVVNDAFSFEHSIDELNGYIQQHQ